MLVFRDDKIKSAGLVIGAGLGVASGFADQTSRPRGRALRLDVSQNVSAVPADCMFVRRDVYKDCGGFDSTNYPDRFADVDLCLRLMRSGYRIIWTPWARLAQASSLKYKQSAELELLRSAWPWYFEHDPHYNPNLSLASANWELAFPPRAATY